MNYRATLVSYPDPPLQHSKRKGRSGEYSQVPPEIVEISGRSISLADLSIIPLVLASLLQQLSFIHHTSNLLKPSKTLQRFSLAHI